MATYFLLTPYNPMMGSRATPWSRTGRYPFYNFYFYKNMPPAQIILVSGLSGSGKSETVKILSQLLRERHPEHKNPVHILRFSDPVKQFAAKFLNSTYSPKVPFTDELMGNMDYKERSWDEYTFAGNPLRIRDVLIFIGMTMREYNQNVWADIAIEQIKKILEEGEWDTTIAPIYYIFDDNRFVNEVDAFTNIGNKLDYFPIDVSGFRIFRNSAIQQGGGSETEIDKLENIYNFIRIDNNDTIETLKVNLECIINTIPGNDKPQDDSFANSFSCRVAGTATMVSPWTQ
jgi:energy-coupling factor transporter ATP-binding protein EcfA2